MPAKPKGSVKANNQEANGKPFNVENNSILLTQSSRVDARTSDAHHSRRQNRAEILCFQRAAEQGRRAGIQ